MDNEMTSEPKERPPATSEARDETKDGATAPAQAETKVRNPEGDSWLGRAWRRARNAVAPHRERLWIALLILGGALRFAQIVFWHGPMDNIWSDPGRHLDNARHFLTPGPMGCSNAYFPQLFLFIVIKLTKEKPIWVHLVYATLCTVYPYIWYRFARTVISRRIHALRFAAVLTFLPTHAIMYQYFMNETLILPLLGGALWATSVAAKKRSVGLYLFATLLWTCTILCRSVAAALALVLLAYVIYRHRPRPLFVRPLLALAGAGITAGGLWIAAQHSLPIFEYATPFGDNSWNKIGFVSGTAIYQVSFKKPKAWTYMYGYSSPSLYISPFDPFYEWKSVRKGTFAFSTNVETHGKDLDEVFWKQLKQNRAMIPRLIFENLIFLTFGHSWPESGKGHWVGRVCLQERWIWAPIMLIAMVWSTRFMYRRRALYLAPAIAVFFTALHYSSQIVMMEGRYRKPLEPLCLLAIFWLISARRRP